MLEAIQKFAQLGLRSFIFFCKFKEHSGVGNLSLEFLLPLDRSLQAAALLQNLLRCFLI